MSRCSTAERPGEVSAQRPHVAHRDAPGVPEGDGGQRPVQPRGEDPERGLLGGLESAIDHVVIGRTDRLQHPLHGLGRVLSVVVDGHHPCSSSGREPVEDGRVLAAVRSELDPADPWVGTCERLDDRLHAVG